MMRKRTFLSGILFFALALSGSGCGSKVAPSQVQPYPPNVRLFAYPAAQVWKALIETIQYDYLMAIEVQDQKQGYFSTEQVRDYQPGQRSKFRLSGTAQFDGQRIIVKLYKHLQVESNNEWKTLPSDLALEARILADVQKRLDAKPPTPR